MRSINGRRKGNIVGSVYLVHFARKYHGKQHYLGFSTNITERVKAHRAGRGAPLLGAVTKHGISWRVAYLDEEGWPLRAMPQARVCAERFVPGM